MNSTPLAKRKCVSPSVHPHIQKNLDRFKETFQKPCQIYKFLNEIWKTNPLYLNRTLSYISKHRHRVARKRTAGIECIARKLLKNQLGLKQDSNGITSRQSTSSNHSPVNGISGISCDISNNNNSNHNDGQADESKTGSKHICYYHWICNDPARTSQTTRSYGYICPWCEKEFSFMDSLMPHLRCSHPRFNFNLIEEDGQSVIEMTLNLSFDGSYCGFKYPGHDLRRDFKFTPRFPERRISTTQIIYLKARTRHTLYNDRATRMKTTNELVNFSYDDSEADVDVCSGRLYYHTSTCLPIKVNELDLDSEADMDPQWLRERTQLMIDEFTDVNEGEKEILKLWNLHIMKNYKYKSDNMMRHACLDFVELEGEFILSNNLTKNFILHLANLYDFGLISSWDLLECTRLLKRMRPPAVSNSPAKSPGKMKLERNSNEHCQSPPAKRALLNSHYNQ